LDAKRKAKAVPEWHTSEKAAIWLIALVIRAQNGQQMLEKCAAEAG